MSTSLLDVFSRLCHRCAITSCVYRSFLVNGHPIGRIRDVLANELKRWPSLFTVSSTQVTLTAEATSIVNRTEAFSDIAGELHRQGWILGWRNEIVPVTLAYGETPLFHIERAALHAFGLPLYAAHINGLCPTSEGWDIWLARRSAAKTVDPGLYDTLVGGALSNDLTILQTLIKESQEEAGIAANVVRKALPAGVLRTERAVADGWHDETIFAHDLVLPEDFQPRNADGEVAEFVRLPMSEVLRLMSETDYITVEASFILCDFLFRTGFCSPDWPGYASLHALIHSRPSGVARC